ncbi:uncharacterized protein LOC130443370 [Diorhabda sublineata]|uniref:uncharacterized protein LOC130443370 n=1 Tax=Diorhabda sublineata TaxID=1163346 RepID=UPI0024E09ABB|nr:uncharacterized protein LOC130443370 [Diorhabda sublineata]
MRKNLQGVLIRTGNRENFTSIEEEDYLDILRTKDRVQFQIFNFQIFVVLKEAHHFHFNLTRRHVWFGNESSGIDGGLSQLVHERKIDISTSGGYLRPARIDYYDFLMPLYKFRSAFIFVNPDRTGPGLEILKPFAIDTWYILVLSLIIIGISIYLTFRFESKSKYSLCSSMLVTISVISQQGIQNVLA